MLHFLMAAPYIGIQGGMAHIKRTLDLDESLNSGAKGHKPKIETNLEDSKIHGLVGGHIGYTYSFSKTFVGIEGYAGTHFGKDLFKPQLSFGVKGIIGMNICPKFQIYAGAGIDFTRFKSLKISSKIYKDSANNKVYDIKRVVQPNLVHPNYHLSPSFLGSVGIKYFIAKDVSVGAEANILFRKTHTFDRSLLEDSGGITINEPTALHTKQNSSEKFRSLQALVNISYHFGGNA